MISFALSSQMLPAIFPYFYDLMLIAFTLLTFIKKNLKIMQLDLVLAVIFIQLFIIFAHLIRYSEYGFYIPALILSDLRPFIIIAFLYSLPKIGNAKNVTIFIVSFIVISNFLINLVGYIDQDTFSNIILRFFGSSYSVGSMEEVYGREVSVSYVASLQGRFCGLFLQPVSSGMVNGFLLLYLYVMKKNKLIEPFLFYALLLMTVFNGYSSLSSAFVFSFILWILYFIPIHKFYIFYGVLFVSLIVFILSIVDIETIIFLMDLYVTSGRYGGDSHIVNLFQSISLNASDYLFGFNLEIKNFYGKGLGDSGLIIKFINGGIIYMIFYYLFIFRIFKIMSFRTHDKTLFSATFMYMLLIESGTNGFSLPQASIIIYGLLFLFNLQFPNVNSTNSYVQKK